MIRSFALVLLVMPIVGAIAEAQTVEPPPRVTPPPRATGTTSSLGVSTSLFGGYDRNLIPADAQRAPNVTFDPSTFRGWGSANLQYALTSATRSLTASGGATANTNRNFTPSSQDAPPVASSGYVYGTQARLGFQTPLGRRTTFTLLESASRTPYYSQGLFGTSPPGGYSPDTNPINGIVDGYRLALTSGATMAYSMTRTSTVSLSYSYNKSQHEGGFTSATSYRSHSGSLNLNQQVGRLVSVQASYFAATHDSVQAGLQYNGVSQGFSLGLSRTQPISRTRTLMMSGGGGASLVRRGSNQYWEPTYHATLATDIARSWSLSSNYSQRSDILVSPLSAPDSYLNQMLSFSVGGFVQRLHLIIFTAATRGEVPANRSVTETTGHYIGLNSGTQLSTPLPGGWSLVFGANYYRSELNGAAKQFLISSGIFQRTSVRLGVTWSAPLIDPDRRRSRRPIDRN